MNTTYNEQKPGLVTAIAVMTLTQRHHQPLLGVRCICNRARNLRRRGLPTDYHLAHHPGHL